MSFQPTFLIAVADRMGSNNDIAGREKAHLVSVVDLCTVRLLSGSEERTGTRQGLFQLAQEELRPRWLSAS